MSIIWKSANETENGLLRAITILFGNDEKLLNFLFDPKVPKIRKRAGILRDESWELDDREQLLVRTALDIWSGSGHVQIWELLENLDEKNLSNCIVALCELNGIGSQVLDALKGRENRHDADCAKTCTAWE